MLYCIGLLFLSVSLGFCASDENVVRVYKANGISQVFLKIEDDHSAKEGHMIIKFNPAFCQRLSTLERYIVSFAKPEDLALWADYDYLFGSLGRESSDIIITKKGISILFSQETIDQINQLQSNRRYAIALMVPLTHAEVQDEFAQISPIKMPQPEKQSPLYVFRRFLSQD